MYEARQGSPDDDEKVRSRTRELDAYDAQVQARELVAKLAKVGDCHRRFLSKAHDKEMASRHWRRPACGRKTLSNAGPAQQHD